MAARLVAFVAVLLLLAAPAASAQVPDSSAVRDSVAFEGTLVPVTVAERRAQAEAVAARLTRLDRAALDAVAAPTVADLLDARTGVFMRRYGAGGLATASLRGGSGAQTLVLLDGQRVADPQSGQLDLTLLPTVLLDGVDVLHGAHGARYGTGAVGGVIRLRTRAPTDSLAMRAHAAAAAFGERTAGGLVSGPLGSGAVRGLVAVEHSRVEGDFGYVNDALFPPASVTRGNADRRQTSVVGRVQAAAPGRTRLGATLWLAETDRGLPGFARASGAQAATARQRDRQGRLLLTAARPLALRADGAPGRLRLDARAQHTALAYRPAATAPDQTTRTWTADAAATWTGLVSGRWLAAPTLEAGYDRAALRGGVGRLRLAAGLRAEGAFLGDRLTVAPALRLDAVRPAGSPRADVAAVAVLSPRLGVAWQPTAWRGLRLTASAGRAFRAPTLGERFFDPGGNPDLRPERGWTGEAGAAVRLGRGGPAFARLEATAYASRLRDQIVWTPSVVSPTVRQWRPRNVGRVRTLGLEVSADGAWRLPLRLGRAPVTLRGGLLFAHTDARNRADPRAAAYDAPLRYVPRQQLKARLGATWGRLAADASVQAVSARFTASDGSRALAPYRVARAHVRYRQPLGPARLTLGLTLENALDARYAVIEDYPMPPRHARVTLTLHPPSPSDAP